MRISAAVLAGGASTRMGRDKAFLHIDGRALVERVVERLRTCSDDVFVVAKRCAPFEEIGLRAVADVTDAQTPLAGIATALRAAAHPLVFVCACDMPFVSPDLVSLIATRLGSADVAVPRRDGRPEPLHAVWSTTASAAVESSLRSGELAVHRAVEGLAVLWIEEADWRSVDAEGLSFVNVNTPADHSEARTTAARSFSSAPFPTARPNA